MIGISKLYCGTVEPSDALRYGRLSSSLPSHLLQFSADKKPVVVWNVGRRCNLRCRHCYTSSADVTFPGELNREQALRVVDDLHAFGIPALIPTDYLPDVHTRLVQYKRIASARDDEGLRELQVEFIDRFGLLPEPAQMLFRLAELRLKANALGIRRMEVGPRGGHLQFREQTAVDPARLIRLIQEQSRIFRLDGQSKLRFNLELEAILNADGISRCSAKESIHFGSAGRIHQCHEFFIVGGSGIHIELFWTALNDHHLLVISKELLLQVTSSMGMLLVYGR